MNTSKIIEINNLTYTYPQRQKPTLENIHLEVSAGEFILLVGATGSGKSTLALCLNGLIPHVLGGSFTGQVTVDGLSTSSSLVSELSTRVGILFQDPEAQICNLYGEDEIAFGLENLTIPRESIMKRIAWMSELLGLDGILNTPTQYLSLGLKQRIVLASLLAMQPRILVLDEPTSNLDPYTAQHLARMLNDFRKSMGITIVVIEHDTDTFVNIADRVVVMDKGKIFLQGSVRDIFLNKADELINLGVRIPQLCGLVMGLHEDGSLLDFTEDLTVDGISKHILSKYKLSVKAPQQEIHGSNHHNFPSPVLSVHDVGLRYGSDKWIFQDVSFRVSKGEIIGLVGPNGAGKTSLGRVLAGIHPPTTGTIEINGIDLASFPPKDRAKQIGFVFQEPDHQFIKHRVEEDLAFSWQNYFEDDELVSQHVKKILERLCLKEHQDSYVYQLSMGQRRKLGITTMLLPDKHLLILDEPMTGLDTESSNTIVKMIYELRNEGLTLIIITHDMRIIGELCNRIIALNSGNIAFNGLPTMLFKDQRLFEKLSLVPPVSYLIKKNLSDVWGMDIPSAMSIGSLIKSLELL